MIIRQWLWLGIGVLACTYSVGCMNSADLEQAENANMKRVREYVYGPMGHYSDLFAGVFYIGSDAKFDYVAIKQGKRTVKVFKVNRGDLGIRHQTVVDVNDKTWLNITDMFPVPQSRVRVVSSRKAAESPPWGAEEVEAND